MTIPARNAPNTTFTFKKLAIAAKRKQMSRTYPGTEDLITRLYLRPFMNRISLGMTARTKPKKARVITTVEKMSADRTPVALTSPVAIARATQRMTSCNVATVSTIFAKRV